MVRVLALVLIPVIRTASDNRLRSRGRAHLSQCRLRCEAKNVFPFQGFFSNKSRARKFDLGLQRSTRFAYGAARAYLRVVHPVESLLEHQKNSVVLESEIYDGLVNLNLSHWIRVFAVLTVRFRGVEHAMEPCEPPPLHLMATLIAELAHTEPAWREHTLFQQLTALSLFHYHASNVTGVWNPLYESLGTFAQRGRPAIWLDHTPHPGPEAVMAWLRKQMDPSER